MKVKSLLFFTILHLPFSAFAQADIKISNPPMAIYAKCLSDAINANNISKSGRSILFTCSNNVAKEFYQLLGGYGYKAKTETIPNSGVFYTRYVTKSENTNGVDRCWQMIEDASGNAISGFNCFIYLPVGDFLNQ